MTISVLLADDQALVRSGFRMILEAQPDIVVVGEAEDGQAAIDLAGTMHPDVILMDVRMPRMDGIEATARVQHLSPAPHVLVLTTFDLDEYVYDALRAGAAGFILKDTTRDQLVHAVRVVAAGDALLAPSTTRRLIAEFTRQRTPPATARLDALTAREHHVLAEVARGRSNAEIAAALVLSEHTVKTHVASILAKLGVRDRLQAVIAAYEAGLGPSSG